MATICYTIIIPTWGLIRFLSISHSVKSTTLTVSLSFRILIIFVSHKWIILARSAMQGRWGAEPPPSGAGWYQRPRRTRWPRAGQWWGPGGDRGTARHPGVGSGRCIQPAGGGPPTVWPSVKSTCTMKQNTPPSGWDWFQAQK